jgi:hypothetical protein
MPRRASGRGTINSSSFFTACRQAAKSFALPGANRDGPSWHRRKVDVEVFGLRPPVTEAASFFATHLATALVPIK